MPKYLKFIRLFSLGIICCKIITICCMYLEKYSQYSWGQYGRNTNVIDHILDISGAINTLKTIHDNILLRIEDISGALINVFHIPKSNISILGYKFYGPTSLYKDSTDRDYYDIANLKIVNLKDSEKAEFPTKLTNEYMLSKEYVDKKFGQSYQKAAIVLWFYNSKSINEEDYTIEIKYLHIHHQSTDDNVDPVKFFDRDDEGWHEPEYIIELNTDQEIKTKTKDGYVVNEPVTNNDSGPIIHKQFDKKYIDDFTRKHPDYDKNPFKNKRHRAIIFIRYGPKWGPYFFKNNQYAIRIKTTDNQNWMGGMDVNQEKITDGIWNRYASKDKKWYAIPQWKPNVRNREMKPLGTAGTYINSSEADFMSEDIDINYIAPAPAPTPTI